MAQHQPSTLLETAASGLLTETVKVVGMSREGTRTGSVTESRLTDVTSLRASIQPRSSLDARWVTGRSPDLTHLMFCKAEDDNCDLLDIRQGDRVVETTRAMREFVILNTPEKYPDPFTGGWSYLVMELSEDRFA